MSIGNTKDKGNNYGNNYPYQLANLKLLGGITDLSTTANGTLLSILAALQGGQNFAQNLVEDLGGAGCPSNCPVYIEIKIWNGTTFDPPVYYDALGNAYNPPGGPAPALVGPLTYINPDFHLAQMVALLTSIDNSIDVNLSTRNAEATQLLIKNLLTTIDGDTSNLDVALSTLNKEATQLLIKNLLTTIDGDTSNLDVALSTRASETTLSTLNGKFVNGTDIGDVTINNASGAAAVNIQDGGNSITVDGSVSASQSGTWNINNISGTVSLPTGAATQTTLASVNTALTAQTTRVHNTVSATGSGTVPASIRGSVINVGNAAGTWNGISLPAGVSIPWDSVGNRDTYGAISYNATGTTFIIEYTT